MPIFSNNSKMGEKTQSNLNQSDALKPVSFINDDLKQCIRRKTKRGRKSKNELPKYSKCEICLEFSKYSSEPLIHCLICNAEIHPSCYKDTIVNQNNFICERCEFAQQNQKEITSYRQTIYLSNIFSCFICNRCDGILYRNNSNGEFFHQICLRFIPELLVTHNSAEICKKNIRRWRYKNSCKYCREKLTQEKAVIKCNNPRCKCYYHIPCAIQKEMIFSINFQTLFYKCPTTKSPLPFYCSGHNKKIATTYRKEVINKGRTTSPPKNELSSKDTTDTTIEENLVRSFDYSNNILHLDFDGLIRNSLEKEDETYFNSQKVNKLYDDLLSTPKDKMGLDFDYGSYNDLDFDFSFQNFFGKENLGSL